MDTFELAYRMATQYKGRENDLAELGYQQDDIKKIIEDPMATQLPVALAYKMANDYVTIQVRTMRGNKAFTDKLEKLRAKLNSDEDTQLLATMLDRLPTTNVWLFDKFNGSY